MSTIIIVVITAVVGFVLGVVVGRNNPKKVAAAIAEADKLVADVKKKL